MKKIILFLIPILVYTKTLSLKHRINPPNRELMDIELINDIMIIPGNLDGYDFYDISDPTNPTIISNFEIPIGNGNRSLPGIWVSANDSIAYFTCRSKQDGSAIVDFSDSNNPNYIGSLPFSEANIENPSFEGLDIFENLLAVAAHEDGVLFYDISNPLEPNFIFQRPCQNAWTVAFIDSNNYVIGNSEHGIILEQFNCQSDTCDSSSFLTEGTVKDIIIKDSLLYIAEGSHGISIYNISNLNQPIFLDRYNTPGLSNKIALFDSNKIAVSDWLDVKILEWTGDSLKLIGYKNTGKRTMAIAAKDSIIYSAEWQHLQTFSYGNIQDADIDINSWDISYPLLEIGQNDTFDLIIENNGNSLLELSNPFINHEDFQIINFPQNIESNYDIITKIIYTKSNQNASGILQIFSNDNDEPELNITLIGNYEGGIVGLPAPNFTLPIAGNGSGDFILSDYLGQIIVLAFFAPGWPVCIPELSDLETSIWQTYSQDSLIIVGITSVNQGQIDQFLDETGITYPILQDESNNGGSGPGGFGGVVYDNYYIPNQGSPYPRDFIIDQNGVLVYANNEVDTEYMLYIIDELLNEEDFINIQNDIINSTEITINSIYPNPFNPITTLNYNLPKYSLVKIEVYDMLGKPIKVLLNKTQSPGYKTINWDATNKFGQNVSSGIYLFSIETENYRHSEKILLLK